MGQEFFLDPSAGVFDDDIQFPVVVFVFRAHHTFVGVVGGTRTELLDDLSEVLLVNVQYQVVIGVVDGSLHLGIQRTPSHVAPAVEEGGKVARRLGEFHHLRIEPGDEEDIVDEVQQLVGIALDLLGEHGLVLYVVGTVEELGKA